MMKPIIHNVMLQKQVKDQIRAYYKNMPSGTKLMSKKDMINILNVSSTTYINAMRVLITEGWLIYIKGKGYFVK